MQSPLSSLGKDIRTVLWFVFFIIAFIAVCLFTSVFAGKAVYTEPVGVYTVYTGGRLENSH